MLKTPAQKDVASVGKGSLKQFLNWKLQIVIRNQMSRNNGRLELDPVLRSHPEGVRTMCRLEITAKGK